MPALKWGEETLVNVTTAGIQQAPAVTALNDGGWVVVWEDYSTAASRIEGLRYDAGGNIVGDEFTVASNTTGSVAPSVAAMADGGFVVAYQTTSVFNGTQDVEARLFDANGVGGAVIPVAADSFEQSDPDVSALGTGFVVSYTKVNTDKNVYVKIFDSTGSQTGIEHAVATTANDQYDSSVAQLSDGNFVVGWYDYTPWISEPFGVGNYSAKTFSATGVAEIGYQLNALGETPVSNGIDVAGLGFTGFEGGFVAVWSIHLDGYPDPFSDNIRIGFFDESGRVLKTDVLVNTADVHEQFSPRITSLHNGNLVVVWDDSSSGTRDIHGQMFNIFGDRIGNEFVINTTDTGLQATPDVTALADGRFVVTWTDGSPNDDDPGGSIRMQIFDPRDGLVTGDSLANTLYGNDIANDEINGLGGADHLYGLGGGDQLFGGDGADTLDGGDGNDRLIGGGAADTLIGGEGNDVFLIGSTEGSNDVFRGGNGFDTLQVTGTAAVTLSGFNAKADSIENWQGNGKGVVGTAAGEIFDFSSLTGVSRLGPVDGSGGNDQMIGSSVGDTLIGGAGKDGLTGGLGKDLLTGGLGNDIFDFNSIKDSVNGVSRDQILDFSRGDRIDVSTIDASIHNSGNQKFAFIGSHAFTHHAGELRYSSHVVQGDVNGDGKADFEIHVNAASLHAGDFVL